MIHHSSALPARFVLLLFTVCFVLALLAVLFLGPVHLGGLPTLAQSSMAVVN